MSKRPREETTQPGAGEVDEELAALDPTVRNVIERYEGALAGFMNSLGPLLDKYSANLQAALPHNPRAALYYAVENSNNGDAETDAAATTETAAPGNAEATAQESSSATGEKGEDGAEAGANGQKTKKVPSTLFAGGGAAGEPPVQRRGSSPMKDSAADASIRRAPTSPLLRRPQLAPSQLEELNLNAKAELERRTSFSGLVPAPKISSVPPSPKPKVADATNGISPDAKAATLPSANAAVENTTAGETNGTATPAEAASTVPPGHKTTLNKLYVTKKTPKDKDGQEAKTTTTAAADDETPKITVAEVLASVEIPALLVHQLRVLKNEAWSLNYTFDQIHDWIAMRAPAMKEDDNQGVAIMASVIGNISSIQSSVQQVHNFEKEYLNARSQLEVHLVGNHENETLRQAIRACDESRWDDIEGGWRTLMRSVIIIHSRLAQNMKTLRKPRESRRHMLSL